MKVIKCPGRARCDSRIQRQGRSIRSYMGWLQENEPHTARKSSGESFLPFHSHKLETHHSIDHPKIRHSFYCLSVQKYQCWLPGTLVKVCSLLQRPRGQEEYEALVCISKLQVITETIRLCNPIGLLWCETKDDIPMQGNESLFPSFSGFWFSLLLTLSAKQGWRNKLACHNQSLLHFCFWPMKSTVKNCDCISYQLLLITCRKEIWYE
jgi:hypothetical protein